MDTKDLQEAIGRPQMARLKALGKGLKVGKVLGRRVLVLTVAPYTEMDKVEKMGLLHIPKSVKEENTPLPTTGIVLLVGPEVMEGTVGEGDMVMFPKFSGSDLLIEEQNMRILDIREILCTLVDTRGEVREEQSDGRL